MKLGHRAVLLLATGFFMGSVPFAPGTFGALIGLPICFFLARLNITLAVVGTVLFIFFAIGLASAAEKILKKDDPAEIVIDEIAGLIVTFVGLPFNVSTAFAGFIIFRTFDIVKPFPIRALEKKVTGGAGVVLDDVLAGIYSNLVLRFAFFILEMIK